MIAKKSNSVTSYQPETIITGITVEFSKTEQDNKVMLYGAIKKDDAEVGNISLNSRDNYLITRLNPYNTLLQTEIDAIYKALPGFIAELMK